MEWIRLAVAYLLILRVGDFDLRSTADALALGAGTLLHRLVVGVARFGRFHGGNSPENS